MPLSKYERKERLPYGEQSKIAAALTEREGVKYTEAFVSLVMNDKVEQLDADRVRKVRVEIAKRLRPRASVAEAFPESDAGTPLVNTEV